MNTAKGSYDRRSNKFVPERDDNGQVRYTSSLLVTFVDTDDQFDLPATLNSQRLALWQEAKPQLSISPNVDYVLSDDSVTEFAATDTKPQAVSATYRPAAVFVE